MMRELSELNKGSLLRLGKHGGWICAEFLALALAIDLVFLLATPDAMGKLLGNAPKDILSEPLYYLYLLASSAAFSVLIGHQAVRIRMFETGGFGDPSVARRAVLSVLWPLIVIHFAIDLGFLTLLSIFIFFGPIFLAFTTLSIPAVVLEQRGWDGIRRALDMAGPMWGPLAIIWSAILIPTIILSEVLSVVMTVQLGEVDAGLPALIYATVTDVPALVMNAYALCLILAAYEKALASENGPDLPDIFR